jgi:glycosyltransferase involved in cell wall biosynthesis
MGNIPLVSICCITYNHEKYIRETIEGFLIQKTKFPIEIIIHDDASADNTANIIREYEKKFPHLITAIYQKENQYSKGVRSITVKFTFPIARGKYIALCEGDDYWTDPYKLQKQVDFLEANPEYTFTFHDAVFLNQVTGEKRIRIGNKKLMK